MNKRVPQGRRTTVFSWHIHRIFDHWKSDGRRGVWEPKILQNAPLELIADFRRKGIADSIFRRFQKRAFLQKITQGFLRQILHVKIRDGTPKNVPKCPQNVSKYPMVQKFAVFMNSQTIHPIVCRSDEKRDGWRTNKVTLPRLLIE